MTGYPGRITIVTGEIESGKTSFCRQMATALLEFGWDTAGILSPAVFEDGKKVAIDVLDLGSGVTERLANLNTAFSGLQGPETKRWRFSERVLEWCNAMLDQAVPCDLLVVDELGPLEFERGEGLTAAFEAVDTRQYRAALLVVRPSLLAKARRRWPDAGVISIGNAGEMSILVQEQLKVLTSA